MSLHLDHDYDEPSPRNTELTLSTTVLLGGIIGLVALCGLFFYLGYSMHHTGPISLPTLAATDTAPPSADFNNFKPAAGSPLHPAVTASPNTPTAPLPPKSLPATPAVTPVSVRPASMAPAPAVVPASTTAGGEFYVQIAAVSHQQDAQQLADTLHGKGYLVTTRTEAQDKLFHVQIGPYASHKDADLIRQKLAGEGYTPFIK